MYDYIWVYTQRYVHTHQLPKHTYLQIIHTSIRTPDTHLIYIYIYIYIYVYIYIYISQKKLIYVE